MKIIVRGLVAVVLITTIALAIVAGRKNASGPVYTVTSLRSSLKLHPELADGRVLSVRAFPSMTLTSEGNSGAESANARVEFVDSPRSSPSDGLWFSAEQAKHTWPILDRFPLLDRLVSAPQQLHFTGSAIYRVRLFPPSPCSRRTCISGSLLDTSIEVVPR